MAIKVLDYEGLKVFSAKVKTLIDKKANVGDIKTKLSQLTEDSTHRLVTDAEKTKWNDGLTKEDLARLDMKDGYLQAQLDKLRQLLITDIRENEISISFENLEGIKLSSGNYNEVRERVEV